MGVSVYAINDGRELPLAPRVAGPESRTTPTRSGRMITATCGRRGLSFAGPTPGIRPIFCRIISSCGASTEPSLHERDLVDFSKRGVPFQGAGDSHVPHENHSLLPGGSLDLRCGAPVEDQLAD